jgi:hypothetical protein
MASSIVRCELQALTRVTTRSWPGCITGQASRAWLAPPPSRCSWCSVKAGGVVEDTDASTEQPAISATADPSILTEGGASQCCQIPASLDSYFKQNSRLLEDLSRLQNFHPRLHLQLHFLQHFLLSSKKICYQINIYHLYYKQDNEPRGTVS